MIDKKLRQNGEMDKLKDLSFDEILFFIKKSK